MGKTPNGGIQDELFFFYLKRSNFFDVGNKIGNKTVAFLKFNNFNINSHLNIILSL
jgi:hypothetical protein